jgi:hypothetical protein
MKKLELSAKEFALFKTLANRARIMFMYYVSAGTIFIEADAASLERLGY